MQITLISLIAWVAASLFSPFFINRTISRACSKPEISKQVPMPDISCASCLVSNSIFEKFDLSAKQSKHTLFGVRAGKVRKEKEYSTHYDKSGWKYTQRSPKMAAGKNGGQWGTAAAGRKLCIKWAEKPKANRGCHPLSAVNVPRAH